MTRFTVVWLRTAQSELVDLWINAPDRQALSASVESIDLELAVNPFTKGDDLHEGLRSFQQWPLRVIFSVNDADRLVEVAAVNWSV